jgi:hypothetical protein
VADKECKGKGKIKGKVVSVLLTQHHAMKAYSGSGGMASGILDLSIRWR